MSFGEGERIELERVVTDGDREGALEFLKTVIYPAVKGSEKSGGCLQETTAPVEELPRAVDKHKKLGSRH